MVGNSPASSFTPNRLYDYDSPPDKVYMAIVEEGLFFDKCGAIRFNSNKWTYLSRLQEKLAGEVAPEVVDIEQEELVEKGILTRSRDMQMFRVGKGKYIWTVGIKIDPEMSSACLKMYKLCHDRN